MHTICIRMVITYSKKRFDMFSPLTGGWSEGLGAFWFFFRELFKPYGNENGPDSYSQIRLSVSDPLSLATDSGYVFFFISLYIKKKTT